MFISAGESSGELYGALLSREIKKRWPDALIYGIGGPRMQAEGVTLIAPMSHLIGLVEVIRHLGEIRATFRKAEQFLTQERPDLLVLIDYPDFNIALAKKAKAAGIPVLYYVSPQVWAWRRGRVKKIAALVDKMAVLFPFETAFYEQTGLSCEFVGHPVMETLDIRGSKEELKRGLGLDAEKRVISLLPGSRPGELNRHQFIIMELAEKITRAFAETQIVLPLASGTEFPANLPEHVRIFHGRTTEALACSDAAAVASGTATLETALLAVPMVVFYRVSPVTFHIAKLLTSVQFISLVNLLSGKEVVKELLQRDASAVMIFSELKKILHDRVYRNNMISNLRKIRETFQGMNPSARVAALAGELARWDAPCNSTALR